MAKFQTFEWKCSLCGERTNTKDNQKAPKCMNHPKAVAMKRTYSFAGVLFKGPGFYTTDNREQNGVPYTVRQDPQGNDRRYFDPPKRGRNK